MTVSITNVGIGSTDEDHTGDTPRVAGAAINTNFANVKAAVEALQATGGAAGNFNTVTVANDVLTTDNEFVLSAEDATTPAIYFDDGDVLRYNRGANSLAFAIASANQFYVDEDETIVSGVLEVNGNEVLSGERNAQLKLTAGTTANPGASIIAYGDLHATKPSYIEIDGDRIGFFGAGAVIQQNVPLTAPSVQDVIDALVALGLVEQSD